MTDPFGDEKQDAFPSSIFVQENDGVIRESVTNSRIIVFAAAAYRSMCDSLFEQFQSGAGIILYRMGQGYARRLVEGIEKLELSTDEAIKVYQRLCYVAGWGNVKIFIEDETKAVCTLHRSAFVLRRKDIGKTSCFIFTGLLSTIATSMMKQEFVAKEVECETGGFPFCKFVLSRV
jgi:predicted hydrocarbon binding protein